MPINGVVNGISNDGKGIGVDTKSGSCGCSGSYWIIDLDHPDGHAYARTILAERTGDPFAGLSLTGTPVSPEILAELLRDSYVEVSNL